MSHLRVMRDGQERPPTESSPASNFRSSDEFRFGPPPSLLAGIITGLLGTGATLISLMLFFRLWQPEPYISPQWLVFVLAGAMIGFFMRLERPFVEVFSQMRTEEPRPR